MHTTVFAVKRFLPVLFICISLFATAQTKSFITDPVTKKRIAYTLTLAGPGKFRVTFSNGKTAYLGIDDIDFNRVYAKAKQAIVMPKPAMSSNYEEVGEGSGDLDLDDLTNKKIKIKPGAYAHISLSKPSNVIIDATDVRLSSGTLDIYNANGLEMYGLAVKDQPYRAVNIRGLSNGIRLHHMTFENVGNSVITYEYTGLWDWTDATVSRDWVFDHLTFIHTGTAVSLGGSLEDAGIKTLMRNFKFLNNVIRDCPTIGSVVYCSAAENYEIAGNVIDNVNTQYDAKYVNGIHNGIFMMVGNGSLHHNKCTNHQGNLIRAWGVSFGKQIKDVLIYDNIVYNSWKYSAFELQVPPFIQAYRKKYPDRITYTNAKVFNNTAGHLNQSRDWEGQLLDLYNTFGTVVVKNNLGFDMVTSDPNRSPATDAMIDGMNGTETKVIRGENKYFRKAESAVADTDSFKSLIPGFGAR